jgi:hypothetical protein
MLLIPNIPPLFVLKSSDVGREHVSRGTLHQEAYFARTMPTNLAAR